MGNPYAGAIGYNAAIDDAIGATARVIDATANGDTRILELGVSVVVAISRLRRQQRHRRRLWKAPTLIEITPLGER